MKKHCSQSLCCFLICPLLKGKCSICKGKIISTIPELAKLLKVSSRTIGRYKRKRLIPYMQARPHCRVIFIKDQVIKSLEHLPKKGEHHDL